MASHDGIISSKLGNLLFPITYSLLPNHPKRGSPISKLLEIEGQSNDATLGTADTSSVFDKVFIL